MYKIFDINHRGLPPGGYPVPDNQVNGKLYKAITSAIIHKLKQDLLSCIQPPPAPFYFQGTELVCTSFALSKAICHAFHHGRVVAGESIDIR